ncbi:MAG TPA: PA14 domain-containing protein [bacterium]|nr:PA14 domain-containing protein [bacterium]
MAAPSGLAFPREAFERALPLLALLAAAVLWRAHEPRIAGALALAALGLAFSGSWLSGLAPTSRFGLVMGGWFAVAVSFAAVPDYAAALPPAFALVAPYSGMILVLGFALLWAGLRTSPDPSPQRPGPRSWQVWGMLLILSAYSLWTTILNLDVPIGYYCDDSAAAIEVSMRMNYLHELPLIGPYSLSETGGHILTAALWRLLPDQSALHISYLGAEVTALANIWLLYFLGREVAGRRVGLICAALGTACKWVPGEVVAVYFPVTATLAATWSLWALVRLAKRPTWLRFAHWALAVSYGTYTYPAFRLFGFFIVGALFIWVFLGPDRKKSPAGWALGAWGGVFWMVNFLVTNGFWHRAGGGSPFGQASVFAFLALGALLLALVLRQYLTRGLDGLVLKLAFGLSTVLLLVSPMIYNKDYSDRFAILNPAAHGDASGMALFHRVGLTFQACFMDAGSWGSSAFDLQAAWLFALGAAVFLARPTWTLALFFAAAWVGLANHFVPEYAYNGRLACAVTPLFLLASVGVGRLWDWGLRLWEPRSWNAFCVMALCSFFAWEAYGSYQNVYRYEVYYPGIEPLVSRQIIQDSPRNRVYLTLLPFCSSPECQGVLDEGHPFYVWRDKNPVYLSPGETLPDLVVLVFAGDTKLKGELQKQYPQAQWTGVDFHTFHYPTADPGDRNPRFYRVLVPAASITKDPSRLIYRVDVPAGGWIRDYYWLSYRPGYGAIRIEDWSPSLQAPPPSQDEVSTASFDGTFRAPADGTYVLTVEDPNFAILRIGSRDVLDNRASGNGPFTARGTVELKKGSYPVHYVVYFRVSPTVPQIKVQVPGSDSAVTLDDLDR